MSKLSSCLKYSYCIENILPLLSDTGALTHAKYSAGNAIYNVYEHFKFVIIRIKRNVIPCLSDMFNGVIALLLQHDNYCLEHVVEFTKTKLFVYLLLM